MAFQLKKIMKKNYCQRTTYSKKWWKFTISSIYVILSQFFLIFSDVTHNDDQWADDHTEFVLSFHSRFCDKFKKSTKISEHSFIQNTLNSSGWYIDYGATNSDHCSTYYFILRMYFRLASILCGERIIHSFLRTKSICDE